MYTPHVGKTIISWVCSCAVGPSMMLRSRLQFTKSDDSVCVTWRLPRSELRRVMTTYLPRCGDHNALGRLPPSCPGTGIGSPQCKPSGENATKVPLLAEKNIL